MIAKLAYKLSNFVPGSDRQSLLSCTLSRDVGRSVLSLNRSGSITDVEAYQ